MGREAKTEPHDEPAFESLSEVLRLLREYGVLDRTHEVMANGVRIQMAIMPPETAPSVPRTKSELLSHLLNLPHEEPPRS